MKSIKKTIKKQSQKIKKLLATADFSWESVLIITWISVSIYFLLEWVFIITKSSFFGSDSLLMKINTLLFSISLFVLLTSFLILIFSIVGILFYKRLDKICKKIALVFSTFLCSSLVLLLIDNFTYTVVNFGIVSTKSSRIIYLFIFLFLSVYFYISLIPKAQALTIAISNRKSNKWGGAIFISLTILVLALTTRVNQIELPNSDSISSQDRATLPNIIIITPDGVNANNLSAYGYDRETTPFLKGLLDNSLVAENAFTNSGNTAGSLISIYTGKYPADTRVLYAPDILKNKDSNEHLLSILKALSYSTTQFSYPYYADAYDRNLRNGLDTANGRSLNNSGALSWILNHLDSNESFFLAQVWSRLLDRLSHIFYFSTMQNLSLLAEGVPQGFDDQFKFDEAINILEQADKPVFIHIHYMGTHGSVLLSQSKFLFSKQRR